MATRQRVMIRPVRPEDARDLYEIVSHPQVTKTTLRLPSMEFAETEAWIKEPKPGQHRLVALVDDRAVGSGSLMVHTRARLTHGARLGLMVHPRYWGQGIATALMEALLDVADNWLSLLRVELDVYTTNEAAVHLYQKFGFEVEATRRMSIFGDGRYHDEYVMARLHADAPSSVMREVPVFTRRTDVRNIYVRPFDNNDIDDLYECFRHPAVARTTLQMPTQEISSVRQRLGARVPGLNRYVVVAEHDNRSTRVIGSISLSQHQNPRQRHVGELGMMVHPHYWGMGIGTRLMEATIDLADDWLDLKRVALEVNPDNPGGIRLYEKFGFEHEGRLRLFNFGAGGWTDVLLMSRLKA